MLQIFLHLKGDLHPDCFLSFVGGASDVRSKDEPTAFRECVERRFFRQRLLAENIERSRGDVSLLERLRERGVVNQLAAGAVHQPHTLLHLLERVGVDHVGGLWSEADVQRDVIGGGIELVERGKLDAEIPGDRGGNERIMRNQLHLECFRPPRYFEPHAA